MTSQRIHSPIVGARFHKGASAALVVQPEGSDVLLVRQPDNAHDKNAVAVFSDPSCKQQLGFVLRDVAKTLAGIMDARGSETMLATYHWCAGRPEISLLIER